MLKPTSLLAFIACIPLANWMIGNVGLQLEPGGPHLVPVGFGEYMPSGSILIAISLVLRDVIQQAYGVRVALVAIAIGAVVSGLVAPASLVAASVASFAISETMNTAVYTPLRRRGLMVAVIASSVVGLVVDSIVFLWIAFGEFSLLWGLLIGKTWCVIAAAIVLHGLDSRGLLPVRGQNA